MVDNCEYLVIFTRPTTLNQWCTHPNPEGNIFWKCPFGEEVKCPLMVHLFTIQDRKGKKK